MKFIILNNNYALPLDQIMIVRRGNTEKLDVIANHDDSKILHTFQAKSTLPDDIKDAIRELLNENLVTVKD